MSYPSVQEVDCEDPHISSIDKHKGFFAVDKVELHNSTLFFFVFLPRFRQINERVTTLVPPRQTGLAV